jgi:hypothetical protein
MERESADETLGRKFLFGGLGSLWHRLLPWSDTTPNISKLRTVCTRLLEHSSAQQPYSLPFRTSGLKQTKQRPVGSVGVEALRRRE